MNQQFRDTDVSPTGGKSKQKDSGKSRQVLPSGAICSSPSNDAMRKFVLAHRSKPPSKDFIRGQSLHDSSEDLHAENTLVPESQESEVQFTDTDMSLPSCLDSSSGFQETDRDRELLWSGQSSDFSSVALLNIYKELMTVYKQLKAERQSQQRRERELHEREKRLKQQEEAFRRLSGLETVHTRDMVMEEKHQQELSKLQDRIREKSKENKRLKSSYDTIKEQNDNMKKQLNELTGQNKKLGSQSKRLQARLENLQRKFELCTMLRGCQIRNVNSTECVKPHTKEKTSASGKCSEKVSPIQLKLLAFLLEWLLDGKVFSSVAGVEVKNLPPEVLMSERCIKVLPLLADQLQHAPLTEANLLLSLLRLVHWALGHLESSPQHVALSATLRRIGEAVSKGLEPAMSSISATGPVSIRPLCHSPCPNTRILSNLIILRTITQADVLAQALDRLCIELKCEESRGLYIHYGGVPVLLSVLRSGRAGLRSPIDILMQLTQQSCYLGLFLEACCCEEFFRTASNILKNPRLELPLLEKLSILLQKLSSIRKSHRLFELSSLHHQIEDLLPKVDPTHTFLCLNLQSILLNLQ
ncbi:coiled-coil domain-containing protein 138 [Menidia menidia]